MTHLNYMYFFFFWSSALMWFHLISWKQPLPSLTKKTIWNVQNERFFILMWYTLYVHAVNITILFHLFNTVIEKLNKYLIERSLEAAGISSLYEPCFEKTGFLHMRKQSRSRAVTAQLIRAFVFAIWIIQSLYFPYPKFRASSHFL